MDIKFNWTCPFCNHAVAVTETNYNLQTVEMWLNQGKGAGGQYPMHVEIIHCPNSVCQQSTLRFCINQTPHYGHLPASPSGSLAGRLTEATRKFGRSWRLIPESDAKSYPDYIPEPIRADYTEASLIRDKSPKASATLARRCLQGMIRDFHGIKKDNLNQEINAIQDKLEPTVWEAIHGIREIGNIGAHMEKDVNVIVNVDPEEASALIELIEILMKEWYVARYERTQALETVKKMANAKKELKNAPPSDKK
jgi:Domain of unknown function (DUF4145)